MTLSFWKRSIVWLGVVATLAWGNLPSAGSVLCLGQDGHALVEAVSSSMDDPGPCAHELAHHASHNQETSDHHHDHGQKPPVIYSSDSSSGLDDGDDSFLRAADDCKHLPLCYLSETVSPNAELAVIPLMAFEIALAWERGLPVIPSWAAYPAQASVSHLAHPPPRPPDKHRLLKTVHLNL